MGRSKRERKQKALGSLKSKHRQYSKLSEVPEYDLEATLASAEAPKVKGDEDIFPELQKCDPQAPVSKTACHMDLNSHLWV
jgi:hypothetical protein